MTPPDRRSGLGREKSAPLGWIRLNRQALAANTISGLIASLLTIAYCLSFSALLFQGELKGGLAMGLWGLLIGSAVAGLYISLTTSLPPAEAGPDNPAVAVLSVLAGTVSAAIAAAGGDSPTAAHHVLVAFSLATLVTGVALYAIGALKLGQVVRYVPYPVVAGFLAASGWFLVTGGLEVTTGRDFNLLDLPTSFPADSLPEVFIAIAFAVAVYALKSKTGSTFVLPLAFAGGSIVLDLILRSQGLMTEGSTWYLSGTSNLEAWSPVRAITDGGIDWSVFLQAAPEIAAVAGVTVIALLLDVTGLEVSRSTSADLDHEFRSNGVANVIAAPLGGIMGNLSMNGSRLLDETGGMERLSGVVASLVVAAIALAKIDLPSVVPAPILAGLLIYLGLIVLSDLALRSPAHRAWTDFGLAILIMGAIVSQGYLAGVLFGLVAACLTFAFNYSRVAVIRRHLTRVVHASNMERSAGAERLLQEEGDRIHIFWLSGFIFFGSSNGLLEGIRKAIEGTPEGRRRFAVLDFSEVSGLDTSALLTLVKLRNFADEKDITLAFSGLSKKMVASMEHIKLFNPRMAHRVFATRNEALEWSENQVLQAEQSRAESGVKNDFEDWLTQELGGKDKARRIARFFEQRSLTPGTPIYLQGAPADTIDLVLDGTVAVTIKSDEGKAHLVRRTSKRTVIGEMGFFRSQPRAADVVPERGAVIYTLDRQSYERLMREEPETGAAFLEFIVRALSDRLEFANSGIAALS